MIAQPTGIVEVLEGTIEVTDGGAVLDVVGRPVVSTSTAKRVQSTRRHYEVDGDVLTYDFWMAHAELPVTHHLHAELHRA